ncbi:nucleoporin NUP42-like [Chrysoperla carnea]|uniref:nucleoporin NUP42-like n=1 Tax=Chrysoperla carnea TaxID=189513 RepID=UPI001D05E09C|nr:nucleoporin NUP42-like [Chrysoperla carnea]
MFEKTIIFTLATVCVVVSSYPMNFEDEAELYSDYITIPAQRVRRSPFGAFGSRNNNPGGGFSNNAGFQHGPFSASVSQGFNRHGMGGPQTFSGGANFANPNTGSGVNFGVNKTPSFGGSATAGGSINLHHTPNGNLNAVGQHTQHYDKDWNRVGQSNFAGLQYQNKDTSVGVGATHVDPKWGKGETQYGVNVEKKF